MSPTEILEALEARRNRSPISLEPPPPADDDARRRWVGRPDEGFELVEDRVALRGLLPALDAREQEILRLRFVEDMPQTAIAERIGCSQMQISRLLQRTLERLRNEEGAPRASAPSSCPSCASPSSAGRRLRSTAFPAVGACPAIVVVTVTVIFSLPTFFRIAIATLVSFSFSVRVWFDGTCTLPLAMMIVFGFFEPLGLALAVAASAGRGRIPAATDPFDVPVPADVAGGRAAADAQQRHVRRVGPEERGW